MSPQQRCLEMIEQADAFVGILGTDYGSEFPTARNEKSIVEWEFDTAIGLQKPEVLAFIKELAPGEVPDVRQRAFIERISTFSSGLWYKRFSTPAELVDSVRAALQGLLIAKWHELNHTLKKLRSWTCGGLLSIAGLSVLVLVIVATRMESLFSTRSMIGFSATIAAFVLLCAVLLLRELR
jgi:hypothetical protein